MPGQEQGCYWVLHLEPPTLCAAMLVDVNICTLLVLIPPSSKGLRYKSVLEMRIYGS